MHALTVHFGRGLWKCLDAVQLLIWDTAQGFVFQMVASHCVRNQPHHTFQTGASGPSLQFKKNTPTAERWEVQRWGGSRAREGYVGLSRDWRSL